MNVAQYILVLGVRFYRWVLSPAKVFLFGPLSSCRFTPSCSDYALQALKRHGALAGTWLAAKRVCRCHPWGGCGYDPVPTAPATRLDLAENQSHAQGAAEMHGMADKTPASIGLS